MVKKVTAMTARVIKTKKPVKNSILKRIKYPKFIVLIIIILTTFFLFRNQQIFSFSAYLIPLGYFGSLIAGIFYSYGFTAAPATAILLILAKTQNIFLAAILGGLGSLFTDLVIFKFIRSSFSDEIEKLSKEKFILFIGNNILRWKWLKKALLPVLGAVIIASPLPDEIGVSLFAVSKQIPDKLFALISFLLNTTGIFVVLLIGTAI